MDRLKQQEKWKKYGLKIRTRDLTKDIFAVLNKEQDKPEYYLTGLESGGVIDHIQINRHNPTKDSSRLMVIIWLRIGGSRYQGRIVVNQIAELPKRVRLISLK